MIQLVISTFEVLLRDSNEKYRQTNFSYKGCKIPIYVLRFIIFLSFLSAVCEWCCWWYWFIFKFGNGLKNGAELIYKTDFNICSRRVSVLLKSFTNWNHSLKWCKKNLVKIMSKSARAWTCTVFMQITHLDPPFTKNLGTRKTGRRINKILFLEQVSERLKYQDFIEWVWLKLTFVSSIKSPIYCQLRLKNRHRAANVPNYKVCKYCLKFTFMANK